MSDFLFSTTPCPPGRLGRTLRAYLGAVTSEVLERHGPWGSLAVAMAPHDRAMLEEDDRSLSILAGDPLVRAEGSRVPERDDERMGVLHELLSSRRVVAWEERLDGPFAVLGIERTGRARVVTDLMASIPVFSAGSAGTGLVLGTHVDAVARAAGVSEEIDPVSVADLFLNMIITFPHTLYPGVRQLSPGAEHVRGPGGVAEERVYWRPEERNPYRSAGEAAEALREALVDDVRGVCLGEERGGILLSAGEDSRAVLGAVPPEVALTAFTYAESDNREVRIARRVAAAYGAEFVFGKRGPWDYLDNLETVGALLGSQHMFIDAHGYGFHERLGLRDLPFVLGGLSADSHLKGAYALPRSHRGPPPSTPLPWLRPEVVAAVRERREEFHGWLAGIRPETAGEWFRLWPFSMRKHGANLHGNRRMFRIHEPFHSNALVKLAAAVPQEWKAGRRLFHRAARPLLARAWHLPHAKHRFPYFGRAANIPLGAGLVVARGLVAAATGRVRENQGSWPKWRKVVRSPAMAAKWARYPLVDTPVRAVFGGGSEVDLHRAMESWPALRELLALQLSILSRTPAEG